MLMPFDVLTGPGDPPEVQEVLYACRAGDVVVLLDKRSPTNWPRVLKWEEAEALATSPAWTVKTGTAPGHPRDDDQKAEHLRRRDEHWAVISAMVAKENIPAVYFKTPRAKLLSATILASGLSRTTVVRILLRWFHGGRSKAALLPLWSNCGNPGERRASGTAKRGRPAAPGHHVGVNVDDGIRRAFRQAIDLSYARERRHDMVSAYHFCVRFFLSVAVPGEDGSPPRYEPLPRFEETGLPTLGQFRYWFAIDFCATKVAQRRESVRKWEMGNRALLGTSTSEAVGPGSRYQIDATVIDTYVVSRADPDVLIGKPTLYVVIDVFSRMIVGVYIGLEHPSWIAAAMALANAVEDKVAFCARHGIAIEPWQWPTHHLCGILEGDRGELESAGVLGIIENYRTTVQTASAYRADWKGIVEQRFKLLPAIFKPYVPGYVETDFRQRGARDYREDAVLTVEDLTRIVLVLVLHHNQHRELKDYPRHKGQLRDEVRSIPLELWDWGVGRFAGTPRAPHPEEYRFHLMPRVEASLTRHGILHQGRFYVCAKGAAEGWFTKDGSKGRKIRISTDKRDVDRIYVHDREAEHGFLVAELGEHSREYAGLTGWECEAMQRDAKRQAAENRVGDALARVDAEAQVGAIVAEPRGRSDGSPRKGSARSRVKGARAARGVELAGDRVGEAAGFSPASRGATKTAPASRADPAAAAVAGPPVAPVDDGVSAPSMRDALRALRDGEGGRA